MIKEIAQLIYDAIAHGDDEHKAWLKAKSTEVAIEVYDLMLSDMRGS